MQTNSSTQIGLLEWLKGRVKPAMASLAFRSGLELGAEQVPFVSPPFKVTRLMTEKTECDALFVTASAAVGKSTLAKQLSSALGAPLLDLARVRVSTSSLDGLLGQTSDPSAARAAFHRGQLPVIVDALDEGILRSGEENIVDFVESSGRFIAMGRSGERCPKLVFFGRYEAITLAQEAFSLFESDLVSERIEIDFFDRDAAYELIRLYADRYAELDSTYHSHPAAALNVTKSYFEAISNALGFQSSALERA